MRKGLYLAFIVAMLLLAACSREEPAEESTLPAATFTFAPTSTATRTIAATPEPTATPEPITPAVSAADQVLEDDARLTIDRVVAAEPGWIVLRADESGRPGPVLGYTKVAEGEHTDVVVSLDPLEASPTIHAVLHQDEGQANTFEYPGVDGPVQLGNDLVMDTFAVDVRARLPGIIVSDQDVTDEGKVVIDEAYTLKPGWLGLHLDQDGQPGRMIAYAPLTKGENEGVPLFINWRAVTPNLHAVLYVDDGEARNFEYPEGDKAIVVDGLPVTATFLVRLPPDIFALDQPIVDDELIVERVISYGPGWLVVYLDDEGSLGNFVGWAPLKDGLNEKIVVPLISSTVTPQLLLMIHEDVDDIGEFEFPRTDQVILYQDRLPNPAIVQINPGNYLFTRDQTLSDEDTFTVPLVVVDQNTWVVVRNEVEGEPGEVIGRTWVPTGINRDVVVRIDPEMITSTLYAILHLDAGTPRTFDFPDGPDVPLQRNRDLIGSPFEYLH